MPNCPFVTGTRKTGPKRGWKRASPCWHQLTLVSVAYHVSTGRFHQVVARCESFRLQLCIPVRDECQWSAGRIVRCQDQEPLAVGCHIETSTDPYGDVMKEQSWCIKRYTIGLLVNVYCHHVGVVPRTIKQAPGWCRRGHPSASRGVLRAGFQGGH